MGALKTTTALTPVQISGRPPMSRNLRITHAVIIVILLLGSLFPPVAGVPLALVGAVLAIPFVLREIVGALPRVHDLIPFTILLLVLFGVSVAVTAPSNDYGVDKATTFFTLTMLGVLSASLVRDSSSLRTLGAVWLGTSLGLSLLTLVGYTGVTRATVFDANPIWLSRAVGVGVIFTFWFWWNKKMRLMPAAAIVGVLLLGMLATGSRGPLLGVVVGVLVLAVVGHRFAIRRLVAILTVGAAGLWALQTLPVFEGNRILYGDDSEGSDQLRGMFWELSADVLQEHPLGVGLGNWASYALPPAQFTYPHNLFVEVFVESGIIIGALFVATIAGVIIALTRRALKTTSANLVLALLAAETIAVSVSGDLNARTFFFLLPLAVLAARSSFDVPETPKDPTRTKRVGSFVSVTGQRRAVRP